MRFFGEKIQKFSIFLARSDTHKTRKWDFGEKRVPSKITKSRISEHLKDGPRLLSGGGECHVFENLQNALSKLLLGFGT